MLIRHQEKPADLAGGGERSARRGKSAPTSSNTAPPASPGAPAPPAAPAPDANGGRPAGLREREVAELRRFVSDQMERYRVDRERLERELAISRQDVAALKEQLHRFKQLLAEQGEAPSPEVTDSAAPSSIVPAAPQVAERPRERYEVRGAPVTVGEGEDAAGDNVLPRIDPNINRDHLNTTEILFARASVAQVEPVEPSSGDFRLAIATAMVVLLSAALLYWEPISVQAAKLLGADIQSTE